MNFAQLLHATGIAVGHAQNFSAATGCTVVLCEAGAVTGVDVRGGAPGTRETDVLNPVNLVETVHAVLLTGGSAFGLDASAGVMAYLEERGIGFDVRVTRVPIVCGAALFDLTLGDHRVRPDKAMGRQACLNATAGECPQGTVGAGTGATVGKILGMDRAMKGGFGHAVVNAGALAVGAAVAVNCLGDVLDPATGRKLAGPLDEAGRTMGDSEEIMADAHTENTHLFSGNTSIGVVVTNARLTKAQATKLASMAHNGYARTMRPAHTMFDGDTIFAMSAGEIRTELSVVGMLAARAMERAVVAAVSTATSLCGVPAHQDLVSLT